MDAMQVDAINGVVNQEELVVDPNEVFPDLGDNQPVEDPEPVENTGQGDMTPDPASDAGGETSGGVGNRPIVHSAMKRPGTAPLWTSCRILPLTIWSSTARRIREP